MINKANTLRLVLFATGSLLHNADISEDAICRHFDGLRAASSIYRCYFRDLNLPWRYCLMIARRVNGWARLLRARC